MNGSNNGRNGAILAALLVLFTLLLGAIWGWMKASNPQEFFGWALGVSIALTFAYLWLLSDD